MSLDENEYFAEEVHAQIDAHPTRARVLIVDEEGKFEPFQEEVQRLRDHGFEIFVCGGEDVGHIFPDDKSRMETFDGALLIQGDQEATTLAYAAATINHNKGRPITWFNGDPEQVGRFVAVKTIELTQESIRREIDIILEATIFVSLDEPIKCEATGGTIQEIKINDLQFGTEYPMIHCLIEEAEQENWREWSFRAVNEDGKLGLHTEHDFDNMERPKDRPDLETHPLRRKEFADQARKVLAVLNQDPRVRERFAVNGHEHD